MRHQTVSECLTGVKTADVCGSDILKQTDRQTERVTSAQTDGVANEGESRCKTIKLAHSKASADVNYGSYSLSWKSQLINANLIQTQIRSGLKFMCKQVLTEGHDFLYLSTAHINPEESGHC